MKTRVNPREEWLPRGKIYVGKQERQNSEDKNEAHPRSCWVLHGFVNFMNSR